MDGPIDSISCISSTKDEWNIRIICLWSVSSEKSFSKIPFSLEMVFMDTADVFGVLTGIGSEREIVKEGKNSKMIVVELSVLGKITSDTLLIEKFKLASVCKSSSFGDPSVSFLKSHSADLTGKLVPSKDLLDQLTQVSGDKDSCSGDNCLTPSKRSPNDVVDLDANIDAANNSFGLNSSESSGIVSGGGSSGQGVTQLYGMDREARVLRYKEKRKNRKFEKTIRYASRKAYAETRSRIKGQVAK
ncbi:hypothetical protein RJT34_02591 [Clitoria ternatea]|uniref:CCT domain-containing protein n=1 Tax=Clitoria ternatea TaxID=43366 RepID=A0AAN9Q0F8_CLITE